MSLVGDQRARRDAERAHEKPDDKRRGQEIELVNTRISRGAAYYFAIEDKWSKCYEVRGFYATKTIMPIQVVDRPAEPHCGGLQWTIVDVDALAQLVALVLVGRAQHAARVLTGAALVDAPTPAEMRAQIQRELFPPVGPLTYHRDGLLFEIICWVVARKAASSTDVISEPHTKATQQGLDMIKVRFDERTRNLSKATIYEYKCTEDARTQFRDHVIPAFTRYFEGARDPQLAQTTIALLARYDLTDEEQVTVYATLVHQRPLAFQAALTVQPSQFPEPLCVALFNGFGTVTPSLADRLGDTFPLDDVRAWFADFAARVWARINV